MAKGISLHIGVNLLDTTHYDGWNGLLRGCENDARDMQSIAAARGFETTIRLSSQATKQQIFEDIRKSSSRLSGGDQFFLSYSGHGGQLPDLNKDEDGDTDDETWCLFDAEIPDDELAALYAEFAPGVRIFVVSDSCHSGTVTKERPLLVALSADNRSVRYKALPMNVSARVYSKNKSFYDPILKDKSLVDAAARTKASVLLLSACQDHQLARDGDVNGVFTEALKSAWADGAFRGTHATLRDEIEKMVPRTQRPNLYYQPRDHEFAQSVPFAFSASNKNTEIESLSEFPVRLHVNQFHSSNAGKSEREVVKMIDYPIVLRVEGASANREIRGGELVLRYAGAAAAGVRGQTESKRFVLATIGGWPETKTVMEQSCVDIPFVGRVCTDLPRIYTRTCTKVIFVDIIYPAGVLRDVEDCVRGAALAAAVGAVISSPAGGAATFEAALKGCLAAKGANWVNDVHVNAGTDSECGEWHPL